VLEGCSNCGAIWKLFDPAQLLDPGEPYFGFRELWSTASPKQA